MYTGKIILFMDESIRISNPVKGRDISIYQIAETLVSSGGEVEEHIQICDEISYVISGSADVYADGKVHRLEAGDIHIIGKDKRHRISASNGTNFRYVSFGIRINETPSVFDAVEDVFCGDALKIKAADEIRTLTTMLISEIYSKPAFSQQMTEMLILQILVLIYRKLADNSAVHPKVDTETCNSVYEILRYIDSNLLNINDVKEISDSLSYSRYYVSHLFKEKLGVSLKEYMTRRKIDVAKDMLCDERISISAIAEKLKYESTQSFSKMFKKHTGITPGQFRKSSGI